MGAMEIWSSPAGYEELSGGAERDGGADPIARELEEGEGPLLPRAGLPPREGVGGRGAERGRAGPARWVGGVGVSPPGGCRRLSRPCVPPPRCGVRGGAPARSAPSQGSRCPVPWGSPGSP